MHSARMRTRMIQNQRNVRGKLRKRKSITQINVRQVFRGTPQRLRFGKPSVENQQIQSFRQSRTVRFRIKLQRISVQNAAAVPVQGRAPEKSGKTPPPPQSPPHTRLHSEVNSFSSEHSIVSRYYSIKLENLQNRFIFFPAKISAGAGKFSFFPFQDLQNRIVTLYYSSCS